MDQLVRLQHLLFEHHPTLTPTDIEDLSSVCDVTPKLVLILMKLRKLEGKDLHHEIVEFIRSHRPDLFTALVEATNHLHQFES